MATAYDADGLRLAIRERIGYDGTTVIGDTELLKILNDVIHDSWDILIQSDVVATHGPFSHVTVAGTREYALSDGAGSTAYKVKRVALIVDGFAYPLEPFELSDTVMAQTGQPWSVGCLPRYRIEYNSSSATPVASIIFDPIPSAVYSFEAWWNPLPPVVSSGASIPFATRFPVGEYIILEGSIRCMRRLRREAGELMADRDRYLARIEQYYQTEQRERAPMALRTRGGPSWRSPWR